jgi:hypothetical protein
VCIYSRLSTEHMYRPMLTLWFFILCLVDGNVQYSIYVLPLW